MDVTFARKESRTHPTDANVCGRPASQDPESLRRPTRVTVIPVGELTEQHLNAWSQIQRADPLFDSPFFRPEFVQQVGQFRDDLEVAVLECDSQTIGFFAFHRLRSGVAQPVGMSLSDFHGVMIVADATFNPRQLLQSCGLNAWHFNHLVAAQREFEPYHWLTADSPYLDLSDGFEHYQQKLRCAGSHTVKEALRKIRKIEREVGPLRLIPYTTDERIFQGLITSKVKQYRRIRSVNHLAEPWRIELLRSISRTRKPEFAGMLSVLLAGEHVVATHLGMLSGGVLHGWFPTYADAFSKYSPGLLFWVRMAEEASSLGIHRIDLGKGGERYKDSLKTGVLPLAEGSVEIRPFKGAVRYGWLRMRELIRSSPLRLPAQMLVRSGRALLSYHSWRQKM
jgi:CelD/BcsL family acetyltransferase involved in cellulose biosynthesis